MTRVLILPTDADPESDSSVVSLPHPATGTMTRYFATRSGVFELTMVDDPVPHSLMLSRHCLDATPFSAPQAVDENSGAFVSSAAVCVATKTAPLYFLLPTLVKFRDFRTFDDILDDLLLASPAFRFISGLLELQISKITDSIEADGVPCFRLSRDKLFAHMTTKARNMVAHLPRNLVRHVNKKLAPVRFDDATPVEMDTRARFHLAVDILAGYLPASLAREFKGMHEPDRAVLAQFVAELESARRTAAMVAAAGAPKRKPDEPKPDKKAEKKAKTSAGVRKLAKVDTSGMPKLSVFFKK